MFCSCIHPTLICRISNVFPEQGGYSISVPSRTHTLRVRSAPYSQGKRTPLGSLCVWGPGLVAQLPRVAVLSEAQAIPPSRVVLDAHGCVPPEVLVFSLFITLCVRLLAYAFGSLANLVTRPIAWMFPISKAN